jgi:hypothetical protein
VISADHRAIERAAAGDLTPSAVIPAVLQTVQRNQSRSQEINPLSRPTGCLPRCSGEQQCSGVSLQRFPQEHSRARPQLLLGAFALCTCASARERLGLRWAASEVSSS